MRHKITLDSITNLVVVVTSIAVLSTIVIRGGGSRPAATNQTPYKLGEQVTWLPGVDFQTAKRGTLVLFISSTCHYCANSMGFYKRLSSSAFRAEGNVQLVVATLEARERIDAFLRGYEVGVDKVVTLGLEQTALRGTPTLLFVDRQGRIAHMWVGEATANGETEILQAVS